MIQLLNRFALGCVFASTTAVVAYQQSGSPAAPPQARTGVAAIVFGVGSPNLSADRSGTSIGIIAGGTLYVFDAGAGVERRIMEAGPKLARLGVQHFGPVFITHLHRDHTLGLPALLQYHRIDSGYLTNSGGANGEGLTIYGPGPADATHLGLREMVGHFQAALADPGVPPGIAPGGELPPIHAIEIKPGVVYQDDNVTVTAFEVTHKTPIAFGFRIQAGNRVIVISGDTRPRDTVIEACNGCDLLFHEMYGLTFQPTGPADSQNGHTSAEELGDLASRAHPKLLVIYHDVAAPHAAVLNVIQQRFHGATVFARDLDIF